MKLSPLQKAIFLRVLAAGSFAGAWSRAQSCSACRARGLKRDRDEGNLRRKTHEIACAACGKMFRGVVLGRRKYCSRKCQPNYSRRYKR